MHSWPKQKFNAQPSFDLYKPSKHHDITDGQMEAYVIDRTEFPEEGGVKIHFKEIPHPRKGWPTIETTESINIVKKLTLFVFKNWYLMLFKSNIERYISLVDYILDNPFKLYLQKHSFYHKEQYYTPFTRAFRQVLEVFLTEINVDIRLAEIIAMIVELDDAYRYRLQDLFSESSQDALTQNPRKEISRLTKIYLERDCEDVHQKMRVFTSFISKIMFLPKYRKAFVKAIKSVDFTKLQYDEGDKYWCLNPSSYKHQGLEDSQKMMRYMFTHLNRMPPTTQLIN